MSNRIQEHNREIMRSAQHRSAEMDAWPSPLEERMKDFLDRNWIKYESQKIFYIYADDGWIVRYYIADFFIPEANVIIEVDGKFHDKHRMHDKQRTKDIQSSYPEIQVLRFKWKDLSDEKKMRELLCKIS